LLLRDKAPDKYGRAAVRWHGRYCREVGAELEEAQAVLALLVLCGGSVLRGARRRRERQ
jgi:hypothetical protein